MTPKLLKGTSFLLFILLYSNIYAQGDLMIMPKRVVFNGNERTKEVNLANTGADTATYAISFIQYKMTNEGKFKQIEKPEPGQRFATDFLRYFPRRVTLAPGEAQTVRVQLTHTGNLEQGEYRSHMYFRAVEKQKALGEEETNDTKGISIKINTVFGISIPIIIREGKSTTQTSLSNIKLEQDKKTGPKLSLEIDRKGNMSVYGDLDVLYISPDGENTEIGRVKGISVYTPNSKREFSFTLQPSEEVDLNKGKIRITYTADTGEELATSEINLE